VHRRASLGPGELAVLDRIPLTSPVLTLVDLAARLSPRELEAAINEADRLELVDPETLLLRLDRVPRHPGLAPLRHRLERETFLLTDSELERRFLRLARAAGLPPPQTRARVNGFEVDFWWPELGLVVETDGLRYHRTPAQQARDHRRDQTHSLAGLRPLRFTHAQVSRESDWVRRMLREVAARLGASVPPN
jgi:very-short-patch-repair endonuclease